MMIERIGRPAMLEQMGEEAAELAKAALIKMRESYTYDQGRGRKGLDSRVHRRSALCWRIKAGN